MSYPRAASAHREFFDEHGGEGDHYAWRVCVNQRTGERSTPGR